MADLILHHYDLSPYAEKIRLIFGLKGLPWQSVQIPRIMPKPDLMPLTGGYRRTPVLQIGADIYCDTELIARELERRHPSPTLYPAGGMGMAAIFGNWAATNLFIPAVQYGLGNNTDKLPLEFFKDRAAMRGAEVNVEGIKANAPRMHNRLRIELEWLESQLADGRKYLLAEQPGLADLSVYHCVWFVRRWGPPVADILTPYPRLTAWLGRIDTIGHGKPVELTGQAALDIAKQAQAATAPLADAGDAEGFKPGDKISVTSEDTGRDPVTGELVALAVNEVALSRKDDRVGEVVVHFPRMGYLVRRAA
jgi:glutathione S-transferase